jgi:uncharacterized protein YkwD
MGILGMLVRLPKRVYRELKYLTLTAFLLSKLLFKIGLGVSIVVAVLFGAVHLSEDIQIGDTSTVSSDGGAPEVTPESSPSNDEPEVDNQNVDLSTDSKTVAGSTYNAAEIEEAVERRLNEYRRQQGVGELEMTSALRETARGYSRDMGQRNFYAHTNPEGMGIQQRIGHVPGCNGVGENIHQVWVNRKYRAPSQGVVMMESQQEVIDFLMESWKASSGHNRNMLKSKWEMGGVGVYVEDNGNTAKIYATQHFCH